MPFNYAKLEGKIKEICGTQSAFASKMGLSERSVSLKLNNQREWKQTEILKICELLDINVNEVHNYFFNSKVQSYEPVLAVR